MRTCTNVTSNRRPAAATILEALRFALAGSLQDGLLRETVPMRAMRTLLLSLSAVAFLFVLALQAQDQDPPSLGDVARQSRQQKQKDVQPKLATAADASTKDASTKDAPAKDSKTKNAPAKDATASAPTKAPHIITNDEIPAHVAAQPYTPGYQPPSVSYPQPNYGAGSPAQGESWKVRIQQMKNVIASQQAQITALNDSIHYASGACVSGCVQWNERQKQKQDQVEGMKAQVEQMQKQLEDMQEACRRQGYGSSVYDP